MVIMWQSVCMNVTSVVCITCDGNMTRKIEKRRKKKDLATPSTVRPDHKFRSQPPARHSIKCLYSHYVP